MKPFFLAVLRFIAFYRSDNTITKYIFRTVKEKIDF